ncbi:hypothetical protein ACH5RR_027654 [Cinchona calisaya]|uniref:DCD domain-containing protein n=1 Tax=Cinchona calisaya TaxID=153742 RepID=A0ABD2YMP9_9GENT
MMAPSSSYNCSRGSPACPDFPEFGAIFMSSRTTKQECLQRNLFGLPLACADFVKNVRSGIILFLFEFERRLLYGVFQAVSDGQMDIVPHAFRSSGKSFPAQVRIRVIWNCRPLPEEEFRDAIRDNYYEAHKFKFGLSKEQVDRLLWLFDSKRFGLQKTPLENKARKRHSRSSDTRNVAIRSGDPGNPRALGPHDWLTSELEPDTHTACALRNLSFSGHKQVKLHEEIKRGDISPTISLGLKDYIPFSSPNCCDIEVNINTKPFVKALYSEAPKKRESTFCLNLYMQSAAQENEDSSRTLEGYRSKLTHADLLPKVVQQEKEEVFGADESDDNILEKSEPRNDKWMKMRRCQTKSFEKRSSSVSQRTSVFSRLSFSSESTEQARKASVFSRLHFEPQVHCNDKVNTSLDKYANYGKNVSKKRRQDVYMANHDNCSSIGRRINMNMLEREYETADDSPSWGKIEKRDFSSEH